MTGSVAIDVVLGLVFIYLIYSLLISILGEMISTWLGLRSRILRNAIERMLNDGHSNGTKNSAGDFILYEYEDFKYSLAGRFYDSSIKFLAKESTRSSLFTQTKPSYISDVAFADTMVHLFRNKGEGNTDLEKIKFCITYNTLHIQSETLLHINNLLLDAEEDVSLFKAKLKAWYNETNDRATGWFKRKMQMILFWLGFVVAGLFNVDTIGIVKKLSNDKVAREQLVAMSIKAGDSTSGIAKVLEQTEDTTFKQDLMAKGYHEVNKALNDASSILGLGWDNVKKREVTVLWILCFEWYDQFNPFRKEFWGLILTALALSLGAPFWFDLLKKLIALRNAGVNPEEKAKVTPTLVENSIKEPEKKVANQQFLSPIEQEAAQLRTQFVNETGIIDVISGFKRNSDGRKERAIEIFVTGKVTADVILEKIKSCQNFPFQIIIADKAITHQADFGEQIYNQQRVNGIGTLGCFAKKIGSTKIYFVSCWHVIKGDRKWYEHSGPTRISDSNQTVIGTITDGTISNKVDVGFAEVASNQRINNDPNILSGFREVTEADAFDETPVHFKGGISGTKTAVIYNNQLNKSFLYPDKKWRKLEDLFSITTYSDNGVAAPSKPGDSGALIVDEDNVPLGIVVGGDTQFTYAVKLSNLLAAGSLYEEYSILNS
jgi:hypothetical protein